MLHKSAIDRIIPILKKDARRALRLKVAGFPSVYYCSFLLRDTEWFNTWASSGSIYRKRNDRSRNVYCDVRVGTYRYDQTTDGGLRDNDDERESAGLLKVPIDDRIYDGLRLSLWRLTEAKFREALSDYNAKEATRISRLDPSRTLKSFTRISKRIVSVKYSQPEQIDEEKITRFCRLASRWMSKLSQVSSSFVEFDASQQTKIFVNTEGSTIVQHEQVFSLVGTLRKLTRDGRNIEQEIIINRALFSELPDLRTFKQMVLSKHQHLLKLIRAKEIHAFSGPVLLCPEPAGLLFHEAIGHRLEGGRLLSSGEGQTFKGQEGKKILNVDLTIRDNPRMRKFRGIHCIGAYQYDDEGIAAKNAHLIQNGNLRGFLTTRAQTSKERAFASNGHARNQKFQRPISRMGVTIIEGRKTVPMAHLKEKLIEEIVRQNKPFGMIVYETSGGETATDSYNFQAFSGQISYATLVFPNGKEVCVRGVNFVGTPLQALNNIIAVGDTLSMDNGFCGAESGMVPVTTICPAVLLSNLELQAKDEELVTQYILPRPKL